MDPQELAAAPGTPVGRRVFLGIVGLGIAGVAFGDTLQRAVSHLTASVGGAGGLASLIPGASQFRIYNVTNSTPAISHADFRLDVGGLVEHPVSLTYADLQRLPRTELVKDFQCVTGWVVPKVHWAGVRLGDILDLVRPSAAAKGVEFSSYDGVYTESLTLGEARRADVLVAYEMLGAPVTAEHGGPVRLYVAPMYGYKSAKWLKGISVVEKTTPGFWEQQGYDVEAWIGASNGYSNAPG